MNDPITKLANYFRDFPGIGERQSKRFVYYLLTKDKNFLEEMANAVMNVKDGVHECISCHRFFAGNSPVCSICNDDHIDHTSLLVIEKDADLESIRKSKNYNGNYFVLGGSIPILEKNPEQKVRINELKNRVEILVKDGLEEIILAFSLTPTGTHTDEIVRSFLNKFCSEHNIKLQSLGRGLSTGTELEYSDSETIKYALKNRS